MIFRIFEQAEELADFASDQLLDIVRNKPQALICLATGSTPQLTYQSFVNKAISQAVDCRQLHFIGLDEWVGIAPDNPGSCAHFLHQHVFHQLNISPRQIHLFNAMANDLPRECRMMEEHIRARGGVDFMVVGIGMNGHVGFNEPNVQADLGVHVAELTETTRQVGQKYFQEPTALTKGLTLGMANFLDSGKVIMLANGGHKAEIIRRTMQDPISMELPATQIRKHKNAYLLLDAQAASALDEVHP